MTANADLCFVVSKDKPVSSAAVAVGRVWLILRQPVESWPPEIQRRYAHHVRRCLRPRDTARPVYRDGEVTLCLQSSCRRKQAGTDDPDCCEYAAGVCCEATLRNTQEPLSSEVLRTIYGKNPAQMKQDIQHEMEQLLRSVLSDSVLCEALECLGLDAAHKKSPV